MVRVRGELFELGREEAGGFRSLHLAAGLAYLPHLAPMNFS